MKSVLKIIFNIIKYIYLFILIIYLVFICFHRLSVDRSIFGYRLFTINNSEMNPKYKVNDIIVVKEYNPSKLKIGDDISYLGNCCGQGGMIINHRIIKIDKEANKIITKGINTGINDPEISYKQVIGKVVGLLPIISFLHHILKNLIGFFIVVVLPIVSTIVVLIIRTIKEINKEKIDEPIEIKEENKEVNEDKEII